MSSSLLAQLLQGTEIVEARSHTSDPDRPWRRNDVRGTDQRHYAIDLIVRDPRINGHRVVRISEFLNALCVQAVHVPVDAQVEMETDTDTDSNLNLEGRRSTMIRDENEETSLKRSDERACKRKEHQDDGFEEGEKRRKDEAGSKIGGRRSSNGVVDVDISPTKRRRIGEEQEQEQEQEPSSPSSPSSFPGARLSPLKRSRASQMGEDATSASDDGGGGGTKEVPTTPMPTPTPMALPAKRRRCEGGKEEQQQQEHERRATLAEAEEEDGEEEEEAVISASQTLSRPARTEDVQSDGGGAACGHGDGGLARGTGPDHEAQSRARAENSNANVERNGAKGAAERRLATRAAFLSARTRPPPPPPLPPSPPPSFPQVLERQQQQQQQQQQQRASTSSSLGRAPQEGAPFANAMQSAVPKSSSSSHLKRFVPSESTRDHHHHQQQRPGQRALGAKRARVQTPQENGASYSARAAIMERARRSAQAQRRQEEQRRQERARQSRNDKNNDKNDTAK